MNFTLRPYQSAARKYINQELNASRNPLLVMPPGTGKSKTSAAISFDRITLGERILVVVPQDIIQEQLLIDYNFLNPGYINSDGVIGRDKKIYIAMAKSLHNLLKNLPEKFIKSFSLLIFDETQFINAQTWRDIIHYFSNCRRLGLTGTPYRMDNQSLGEFYDSIYEPIKKCEAIAQSYLCESIVIVPNEYKNFVYEKKISDDENKKLIHKGKAIGDIVELYNSIFDGLPVIIPAATISFAKEIIKMFSDAGWNAKFVSGTDNKNERKKIIRDIKHGKINQLVVVGVGIYGMDIPELCGIIWMRQTESLTIFDQLNGRIARPCAGKKYGVVVDPVGNCVIHGHPDSTRKWSLNYDYNPADKNLESIKMKLCKNCGVMNSENNITCHICGHDFSVVVDFEKKERAGLKIIDGELVFLEDCGEIKDQFKTKKNEEIEIEKTKFSSADKLALLKIGIEKRGGIFEKTRKNFL